MAKKRIAAILFAAALCLNASAEKNVAAETTTGINGDSKGICWRTIDEGKALQVLIPTSGDQPENLTVLPTEVTRLVGKFVSASQDSAGLIKVEVEMPAGKQSFTCSDEIWLKGQKDQVVCWTELYSLQGDKIRFVQDWMLLTKADAGHYVAYNESYVRPDYQLTETTKPTFPDAKPISNAQTGKKDGAFRIVGGKSKAAKRQEKVQKAAKKGNVVARTRYVNG